MNIAIATGTRADWGSFILWPRLYAVATQSLSYWPHISI